MWNPYCLEITNPVMHRNWYKNYSFEEPLFFVKWASSLYRFSKPVKLPLPYLLCVLNFAMEGCVS